jgi:hypothetical protein
MTISTVAGSAGLDTSSERVSISYALCLLLPGIVIGGSAVGTRSLKRKFHRLCVTMLLLLTFFLLSCGGVSSGGSAPPPAGKQPTTYQITVTGTSSGTPTDAGQSAIVTLVVD